MIALDVRPKLATKARLRLDRKTGRHMLLFPEKGLLLNATGTAILQLCSGEHSVSVIIDKLAQSYVGQPRSTIEAEVITFLGALAERGLIEEAT